MSFLKRLFGGGAAREAAAPAIDGEEEYKGFQILAKLMKDGGEYQIAGLIEKEVGGELKTHSFIRADKFTSKDDCVAATLAKGRQIIDEQGNFLFD
ncbi:HlyU family transcriptional regulator [Pelagibacterium lacus]|uniref:Transcriptional activator HlyU n=1 Tax=Pelagibacterium lacus TaxID=2282655 RepID=A0A369W1S6_9HYPH|nr:HlyU family transcriptional regulator [Pelagibacterium lacus]RDE07907.1 hypothetical protein DVH29_14245 [Pelagibacterium lacus]